MPVLEGGTIRGTMDELGRLRRGGQLPACRQGAPPGHRGTARLPVPAIGRPGSNPHRHRPEGTPDRQAPRRGGTAQEDPAGTGYRNTDGPGHRFTEKPKY